MTAYPTTFHRVEHRVTTEDESILGSGSYCGGFPLGEHDDCLRGRQVADFFVDAAHQNLRIDSGIA